MNYVSLIIGELMGFVIYALVGVLGAKMGILDDKGLDRFSAFIVRLALPLMIFHKMITLASPQALLMRLPAFLVACLMFALQWVFSVVLQKGFRLTGDKGRVYLATTLFGNFGFMGIPIMMALFPENGMIYISLVTLIDQGMFWTYGAALTAPGGAAGEKKPVSDVLKKIFNAGTIMMIVGLAGLFAGVHLPAFLDKALTSIDGIVSPLAIIYLGGTFFHCDIRQAFRKAEFYAAIAARMIVFPIAFYLLLRLFPMIEPEVKIAMAILSGMPAMTSVAIMAKVQGSEGDYSAQQVFLTTLFSIVTLPIVCWVVTVLL